MIRYFAAANFWLFLAAATLVGKTAMRSESDMYAVFGAGRWFEPGQYSILVTTLFVISLVFFVLAAVTRGWGDS